MVNFLIPETIKKFKKEIKTDFNKDKHKKVKK